MADYFEFHCPVNIVAGTLALEHLAHELDSRQSLRPALLADAGVVAAGLTSLLAEVLGQVGRGCVIECCDIPPDSNFEVVHQIVQQCRAAEVDSLIAIGGGSVLDTAKVVNVLLSVGGTDLHAYAGAGVINQRLQPLYVIPTTAGTGSEVTTVAVIRDAHKDVKVPFTSAYLMPDVAIIDPRMTASLPPHITAFTGMDALTHAIEAYLSLAKNPLSDAYAEAAIRMIAGHLAEAVRHPGNVEARLAMAQGATMAGIAFSNAMVGLVHALGHSVGALCHLPHGLCMSILLPYVLTFSRDEIEAELSTLLLPLVGAEQFAQTPPAERADAAIDAIHQLKRELYELAEVPQTLSQTGRVGQAVLPDIAALALNDGALLFNRAEIDHRQALAILSAAF